MERMDVSIRKGTDVLVESICQLIAKTNFKVDPTQSE